MKLGPINQNHINQKHTNLKNTNQNLIIIDHI